MELLIWIAGTLIGGVLAVGLNLLSSELYDQCPRLAHWLLNRAVDRLPLPVRERYMEEWLAHLEDCEGKVSKVIHVLQCWACARTLAKARHGAEFTLEILYPVERSGQTEFVGESLKMSPETCLFILQVLSKRKPLNGPMSRTIERLQAVLGPDVQPDIEELKAFGLVMLKMHEVEEVKALGGVIIRTAE